LTGPTTGLLGVAKRPSTDGADAKPVQRFELRGISAADQEFRADIPPGLPVTEETSPFSDLRPSRVSPPPGLPVAIATAIGRQAAKEAGKAARNLLNRLQARQPDDRT
jgi:hypothetical protein